MELTLVLKAISDETRMKIIKLLLGHDYCVRGLARRLELSESAISQHLKVMKEAGVLVGQKRGYFIHYEVNKEVLLEVARQLEVLVGGEVHSCIAASESGCQKERCQCQFKKVSKNSKE